MLKEKGPQALKRTYRQDHHYKNRTDKEIENVQTSALRVQSSEVKIKDKIPVTKGQLHYEFGHLLKKIKNRDQDLYREFKNLNDI